MRYKRIGPGMYQVLLGGMPAGHVLRIEHCGAVWWHYCCIQDDRPYRTATERTRNEAVRQAWHMEECGCD